MTICDKCNTLEQAIRNHRDQRGDDRCWLDDQELYAVLPDSQPMNVLPPKEVFLANCARYQQCRDPAGKAAYTAVDPRDEQIAALQLKILNLEVEANRLKDTLEQKNYEINTMLDLKNTRD